MTKEGRVWIREITRNGKAVIWMESGKHERARGMVVVGMANAAFAYLAACGHRDEELEKCADSMADVIGGWWDARNEFKDPRNDSLSRRERQGSTQTYWRPAPIEANLEGDVKGMPDLGTYPEVRLDLARRVGYVPDHWTLVSQTGDRVMHHGPTHAEFVIECDEEAEAAGYGTMCNFSARLVHACESRQVPQGDEFIQIGQAAIIAYLIRIGIIPNPDESAATESTQLLN